MSTVTQATLDGFILPEGFTPPAPVAYATTMLGEGVALRQIEVTPALAAGIAAHLKHEGARVLRAFPIERLLEILDEAAHVWLEKRAADYEPIIDAMAAVTGFSRPMIEESVRIEQHSSRADDMRAALTNEFGDPAVLDRFVERLGTRAQTRAIGPALTYCLLPGNIPGLSHLPFMRSLLVKSPLLCKTSSTEPVYAAAYARTLIEICPALAPALAVLYWPGGEGTIEEAVYAEAEAVIAFGGIEACTHAARSARPGTRLILHGHKLGFAVLGRQTSRSELDALARGLAYDIAMFDQQACLSPHWIFIETGGALSLQDWGNALAGALRGMEEELPKGRAPIEERVAYANAWDDAEIAAVEDAGVALYSRRRTDGFLLAEDARPGLRPGCLGRATRLIPVANLADLESRLTPLAGYLQNAALHIDSEREPALLETLAQLGVNRICRPGRMPVPTMMWHHDGLPCLEAMVRYCDIETE